MIVGIGVDVVGVPRFAALLVRRPGVADRLFAPEELAPAGRPLSMASLAARFAAKEALAKALGAPPGLAWRDAQVVRDRAGRPRIAPSGSVAAEMARQGVAVLHVSLSHDAELATAMVVAESTPGRASDPGVW
ncbi:MAG: holo-ACP synthase [Actinomycetes bacterium]